MTSKLIKILLGAGLVAGTAVAQEAFKVEPSHYKLGFENEHVQVVYVHYGPHEKSALHEHPGGVVVNITGGHLRFTDQTGKVREVFSKAGEARWFAPFKHRVENLGDEPYNAVYVGVKGRLSAGGKDGATLDGETAAIMNALLLGGSSHGGGQNRRIGARNGTVNAPTSFPFVANLWPLC
jgi:beta-alanine degradation protein BauB